MRSDSTHEIAPGLWHWTGRHPRIGQPVSSYYLMEERVLLDPLLPRRGADWFRDHEAPPEHIVLTNRHHDRHSWRLRDEFGCEVHCIETGIHELDGRGPATPFAFGDELPGGIVVHEVDAISPDETALHIPAHDALACADGVVRLSGPDLEFVPDHLMDHPERTKAGLLYRYKGLLELPFSHLLLAHGDPVVGDGKRALAEFVAE
jgi:hypothetical protein